MAVMTLLEIVTCKRHRKQNKGTPMCLHNIESGKVIIKLFKLVQTKCCAMIISIIQVLLKILYKNLLRSTKFFTNFSTKQRQKERKREREKEKERERERERQRERERVICYGTGLCLTGNIYCFFQSHSSRSSLVNISNFWQN